MLRKIPMAFFIGVVVLLVLANCGGGGAGAGGDAGPFGKILGHYDAMIKIIRDNKADPTKASEELNVYQEKNKMELESLQAEIQTFAEKDPMKALQLSAELIKKTEELTTLTSELVPVN